MKLPVFVLAFLFSTGLAYAEGENENGLVTKRSKYSTTETLNRLSDALAAKGIKVMARIDHKKNAQSVDLSLRPTELLIFGNPKLGTLFMTSNQTAGLDLPLKALAWEDEKGQVWLTYNDPYYVAKRHHIEDRNDVAEKMSKALDNFTTTATGN